MSWLSIKTGKTQTYTTIPLPPELIFEIDLPCLILFDFRGPLFGTEYFFILVDISVQIKLNTDTERGTNVKY